MLEQYELERVVDTIRQGAYTAVALQFSEECQNNSVLVVQELTSLANCLPQAVEFYVLADTSYGSCCVDQVAAQHMDADLIVHFGAACLSRNALSIPVLYIFCAAPFSTETLDRFDSYFTSVITGAAATPSRPFLLFPSTTYSMYSEPLLDRLRQRFPNKTFILAHTVSFTNHRVLSEWDCFTGLDPVSGKKTWELEYFMERPCVRPMDCALEEAAILYIGPEGRQLTAILLSTYGREVYSADPLRCGDAFGRQEGVMVNKQLMRRCMVIEKALSTEIFGILIGTLGVQNYLEVVSKLIGAITEAGKKFFIISVGKLNPAKLANFMEIDAFILVACHENSFLEFRTEKEFFKPILTPFEVLSALDSNATYSPLDTMKNWSSDFNVFLKQQQQEEGDLKYDASVNELSKLGLSEENTGPRYSFATGKLVQVRRNLQNPDGNTLFLAYEPSQSAFDRFQGRQFKGLEKRDYEQESSTCDIVIGKKGTARQYHDENTCR